MNTKWSMLMLIGSLQWWMLIAHADSFLVPLCTACTNSMLLSSIMHTHTLVKRSHSHPHHSAFQSSSHSTNEDHSHPTDSSGGGDVPSGKYYYNTGRKQHERVANSSPASLFAVPVDQYPSMNNVTVAVGRNATFECVFRDLHRKDFLLAWFHRDSHTLLAMNDRVVRPNGRYSVRSHANTTFYLTIHDVRDTDAGSYMCQVNTNPMRNQIGFLEVNVPPSFIEQGTSSDVDVREGAEVSLQCRATGRPAPSISWRREQLELGGGGSGSGTVASRGERLTLTNVTRHQIGAYLCIASNGIQPTISKRIFLGVSFAPTIWTPKTVIGAEVNGTARLECNLEGYPRPSVYWLHSVDERDQPMPIVQYPHHQHHSSHQHHQRHPTNKYDIDVRDTKTPYLFNVQLDIHRVHKSDYGLYTCVGKNLHGESKTSIKLYEVQPPPTPAPTPPKRPKLTTTTTTPTSSTTTTRRPVFRSKSANINRIANGDDDDNDGDDEDLDEFETNYVKPALPSDSNRKRTRWPSSGISFTTPHVVVVFISTLSMLVVF